MKKITQYYYAMIIILWLVCSLVTFLPAQTVTVSFQNGASGYNGARDTKLISEEPATNFGSADELELDGSPDRSALLYWDLASIPPGSIIQSVDIIVDITSTSSHTYEFYELLRPWVEGEATWNEYSSGQSWQIAGADGSGDRGSSVLGVLNAPVEGFVTISLNTVGVAVVQGWVDDPASNHGFIVMDYINASDGLDFSSRKAGTVSNRPKLTVTYAASGQPLLTINDVTVTEGNAGTVDATFTISLFPLSSETVTVHYATADGSAATADNDYVAISGQVNFQPGETGQPVTVTVNGDITEEPDETFFVYLSSAVNATIWDNQGKGTILDDDTPHSIPGEPITFTVTGDYPYLDEIDLFEQHMNDHNLYSPSDFFVHVGDLFDQSDGCHEEYYQLVADLLKTLAVPAFVVIGDNDWMDCSDPAQGFQWWVENFAYFEQNFCGASYVERQDVRPENWAFVMKGVLFAGINIPGGSAGGGERDIRLQDDADWVDFQFQDKAEQVRAAVVFGHNGPSSSHELFFDQFGVSSITFAKPVFYIQGHEHDWLLDNPWGIPNMQRLVVSRGGEEDPAQITVTMDINSPFEIEREPWLNNPPLFNREPCVEAGSDRVISLFDTLDLGGVATDDGVPANPGNLTVTWSKVSGPGNVAFEDANVLNSAVNFSSGGSYVLQLTADDGELTTSDELAVDVKNLGPTLTMSFQDGVNGYPGTRDTKLLSDAPSTNNGNSTILDVDGDPDKSTLMYWDLSGLSSGNTIKLVEITVNVINTSGSAYEFYELKRPWVESQAAWNISATGQNWQVPGADGSLDRGSTVVGAITASTLGLETIALNEDGIAVVQSWITDPSSNHGFILHDYLNNSNSLVISSRETGNLAQRPKLTITYALTPSPILVNARVYLEGAWNNGTMRTDLRDSGLLPLNQPFNTAPWNYDGAETVGVIPAGVVDWVLVKLRTSPAAADEVVGRAAFIKNDGSIVDLDGSSPVGFTGIAAWDYYIVIYHRNHLAVMSNGAQPLSNSSSLYNFTIAQAQAYGNDALKELSPGIFGMVAGDGNSNGHVDDMDKDQYWHSQNGTPWEYLKLADYNLDGGIDARDLNLYWRGNNGVSTQVP